MAQGIPASPVGRGGGGVLRLVSNEELMAAERAKLEDAKMLEEDQKRAVNNLAKMVSDKYYAFRRERETRGTSALLVKALRAYRGQYAPDKIAEIKKFGGSDVYSRLTALKCRGATAMLRDVFLNGGRTWRLGPTPVPTLPDDILGSISQLVQTEAMAMSMMGQSVDQTQLADRTASLHESALRAAKKRAILDAKQAENRLDDILVEGGFYDALREFLHDLTIFPYACIKGPVVQQTTSVQWENGRPVVGTRPKMFWHRVDPFNLFFTPGASSIEDAEVVERIRLRRTDLNLLIGVPGYDEEAIRKVLDQYGRGGLVNWLDMTDSEEAELQRKEDPHFNQSELIDTLEFHGTVQGRTLRENGFDEKQVPDELLDYSVRVWVIGDYVIRALINPNPTKRHPYYVTSFEKIPGAIAGHALPEILEDIQDVANASLRSMVNNLAISSGPQVIIDDALQAPNSDTDELYPWKRWHVESDPMSNGNRRPVEFYQPNSYANELLGIYEKLTYIADEISAIPRYITGSERLGGAGRTASGLAMLMQNTSKVLQGVASNVDADVFRQALQQLYDMVLLTDESGTLRGDESIEVKGVAVAVQKETERMRQLEFLQLTANPMDQQIVGLKGRASLLRSVADTLGLDHEGIVPTDSDLMEQQQQAMMMQQMGAGGMPGAPIGQPPQGPQPRGVAERMEQPMENMTRGPSGKVS